MLPFERGATTPGVMPCLSVLCKRNVTVVSLMQDQRKGWGSSEIEQ